MPIKENNDPRKQESLRVLENIARHLRSLTPDIYYTELEHRGFTVEERVRFVGGSFATAKSRSHKWLIRTPYTLNSARNRGNNVRVWVSNIFGVDVSGNPIDPKLIEAYYQLVEQKYNLVIPDDLGRAWVLQNSLSTIGKPSASSPYLSAYLSSASQNAPVFRGKRI